tara:strand:+ start:20908 stop:22020 length:1113 start_codon:yes stop_codon:yes gene_type:complete
MKNIPVAKPFLNISESKEVYKTLNSKWITMGNQVKKFEKQFANSVDAKYALATNNGTSALHLCLRAIGIKPYDEVIIPNITFISTINVVLYEKAIPVLIDCSSEDFNIIPEKIEKKITKKTKAIIGVDMNGLPFDYDKIIKITKKYNIKLIADSAESYGSKYKNKKIGSIAPLHSFSFFANKNITTGEGGMITTDSYKYYKKIVILRNQGQNYRYNHIDLGYNYRMTDISASIGLVQLKKFKKTKKNKNLIVNRYNQILKNNKYYRIANLPKYSHEHSWYNFTLILYNNKFRNFMASQLQLAGIETRFSFPPLSRQPFIKKNTNILKQDLKNSEEGWKRLINIPIFTELTFKEQTYICKKIKEITNKFFA